MNKPIYIKEIDHIMTRFSPYPHAQTMSWADRQHPEYVFWLKNPVLLELKFILKSNPGERLVKVSLDKLHDLYLKHWQEIAGSLACYTGTKPQTRINILLIEIAKCISQAFPERYSHYYKLIMPTATNLDKSFVTSFDAVVETPLEDLFVADDGSLLSVLDTIAVAQDDHLLSHTESKNRRPLTLEEKEQLLRHTKAKNLATQLMFPAKRKLDPNVVNIRLATIDAVRLLGIGCLYGDGERSQAAIVVFAEYINTIPTVEKAELDKYRDFKIVYDALIAGEECIYACGRFFCALAYDFIRDEAKWSARHIQSFFDQHTRNTLNAKYPLKICFDTVAVEQKAEPQQNLDLNAIDAEQAHSQLEFILNFILMNDWGLAGKDIVEVEVPGSFTRKRLPQLVKEGYLIIHKGLRHDNHPVRLLLEVKNHFCQCYLQRKVTSEDENLAFYRSFYTNKFLSYMAEKLTKQPTPDHMMFAIPNSNNY